MRKIDTPCKNCERKGCGAYHDHCDKYQEYRQQKDAIIKEKIKCVKEYEAFHSSLNEKRKMNWRKYHKSHY